MSLFRRRGSGAQTVGNPPPIRVSPPLAQNPQTAPDPVAEAARAVGLTEAEHDAIEMTARLWDHLALFVVDRGPSAAGDLAELAAHLHAIQRAVLANAAARAHPDLYRVLGGTVTGKRP